MTSPAATESLLSETVRRSLPICILSDKPEVVELTSDKLSQLGFRTFDTTRTDDALSEVQVGACRVVLADVNTPGVDGLSFLEKSLQIDPSIAVILVTGVYSVDAAIEAIRRGAHDFLCRPINEERLVKALDELAEVCALRSQIRTLDDQLPSNVEFEGIVGRNPAMLEMLDMVRKMSRHYTNVRLAAARTFKQPA